MQSIIVFFHFINKLQLTNMRHLIPIFISQAVIVQVTTETIFYDIG